jgi:uncharacterized protein YuzE
LYIHLSERPSVDSDEVAEGVVLDFAEDGALVGIDVQHASQNADMDCWSRVFLSGTWKRRRVGIAHRPFFFAFRSAARRYTFAD